MSDEDGASLTEGGAVTLSLGGESLDAFVSEVGAVRRYGDLPLGVEPGSEADDRPSRRLVVFCWPWSEDQDAPDFSGGDGQRHVVDCVSDAESLVDMLCHQ